MPKRFHFSLETLLQLRRREEEKVKLELAAKREEVKEASQALEALSHELKQLQKMQLVERAEKTDITSMRHGVAYRHKLKLDMLKQGRRMNDLEVQAENIRKRLVKATQQVRALELLREKRYMQWRKEYKAEEQERIDDVSQQGFIRRKDAEESRLS